MTKLEKMRDELADKWASEHLNVETGFAAFKAGFSAADAHYRPIVQELVKALEQIAEMKYDNDLGWGGTARQALESVRGKL